MSGPVTEADLDTAEVSTPPPDDGAIEVLASRSAVVAGETVRRALPRRAHRTIGAWCFLDHFGPTEVTAEQAMMVGPHPHIGLHTVTWLLEGEVVHTDSLGSEQPIRPGQLNLMTAGRGVAHAEDGRGLRAERMHGVQLWVVQPDSTRHGPPAFEHHAELPQVDLGAGTATVLVGGFGDERSTARTDTPLIGLDLELTGPVEMELAPGFEYGLVVLDGAVTVDGTAVGGDELAYLGTGRDGIGVNPQRRARVLLLGGEPFVEPILMWWNFVARSRTEIDEALRSWDTSDERFGAVRSTLDPMPVPSPPWLS
jgi:redox-sensitive bicupin YhaK (pirin superfamily)